MKYAKYLPTIIAAIVGAGVAVAPTMQGEVKTHPSLDAILAAIYAIIAHWLPSPASS